MKRFALIVILVLAAATVAAAERHSGRVIAVDEAAGTLRLDELVEGVGGQTRAVERRLRVAPEATIQLRRAPRTREAGQWPDAWEAQPLTLGALAPGDFVTVTTAGDAGVALEVVRPAR